MSNFFDNVSCLDAGQRYSENYTGSKTILAPKIGPQKEKAKQS